MSKVVMLRGERTEAAAARPSLGPAEVLRVYPNEVEVRLKSGAFVRAQMALATPYEAVVGDLLLVIGDAEGHYVIGVLQGSGRSTLELPGDVELRAVNGTLRLSGDKGVEVAAPQMSVRVDSLQVIAGKVVQRFASLCQRVSDLLSVQAGERSTVVEGSSHEQAKTLTIVTEESARINGKGVYLG